MLIRLGHSPDPHDAIMFRALTAHRVDTRGFEFETIVQELATLDAWALEGKLDATVVSTPTYPRVQDEYVLLPQGMRMSSGVVQAPPETAGPTTEALVRRFARDAEQDEEAEPDLGQWWLLETGLPLPLTVTVARRTLGDERLRDLAAVLQASIDVAGTVDDYRCDHGEEGRLAVRELLARAERLGVYDRTVQIDFVD